MPGLTVSNPVSLSNVLTSHWVLPGDEIVLLPGTYTATEKGVSGANEPGKGVFRVKLHGTADKKITIRPQVKGTVRINGGLEIVGGEASYIIVKDLEIAPTPTDRTMLRADVDFPSCIYCTAPGCEIIGNYLHDGMEGLSVFGTGGCVIRDNVVINIGWVDLDGGHGTGIYTHNNPGGEVLLQNNVFNALGEHAVNMWSASINLVQDYLCEENVVYIGHLYCGCQNAISRNNIIRGNHIYRGALRLGISNPLNGTVLAEQNRAYYRYPANRLWWQLEATVQNNIFVTYESYIMSYYPSETQSENVLGGNTYYYGSKNPAHVAVFNETNGSVISWQDWNALGYDVDSQTLSGYPTANEVFVYPNADEGAFVVIWNWENLASVDVDLTPASLAENSVYVWRNAQDPYTDIGVFTYTGEAIALDMRADSHTVAPCVGYTPFSKTFPLFGCFVVEKSA